MVKNHLHRRRYRHPAAFPCPCTLTAAQAKSLVGASQITTGHTNP